MKQALSSSAIAVAFVLAFAGWSYGQIKIQTSNLAGGGGFTQGDGVRIGVTLGQTLAGFGGDELNVGAAGFWYTTLESITVVSSSIERLGDEIPVQYELQQNYPNPFNPTTRIRYGLPESARVRVTIYNVLGQLLSTVTDADQPAGYYEVTWDAKSDVGMTLPSGLYFYRVETKNFSATRSMVFHK